MLSEDACYDYLSDDAGNHRTCGSYSYCSTNKSTTAAFCNCIEGFNPKPELSGGCVRRTALKCNNEDQFLLLKNMKLPEKSDDTLMSGTVDFCKKECRKDCECTAFAFVEMLDLRGEHECVYWKGELNDMQEYTVGGQDLYVRVAPKDPDTASASLKPWIIGLIVGGIVLFILFCFCVCFCFWKRMKRSASPTQGPNQTEIMISEIAGEDRFTFMDFTTIVEATDNFSSSNILGRGGFGIVYKAILPNGTEAAVKRLSIKSSQGIEEFKNEVRTILNVLHKNLVRLQGCCCEGMERILVYEFLENSSLNRYLFDEARSRLLNWEKRFRIISEIAQGLSYLHNFRDSPIIHRDLKPSNILLDKNLTSKISDFGMAKILESGTTEAQTQRVAGTYGYMSEEYAMSNTMSEKSDVFSFGVMILEIITGQQNAKFCTSHIGDSLLSFVWRRWNEGNGLELVDSNFIDDSLVEEEVLRCTQIGLCCVQDEAENRPSTDLLVVMLKSRTAEIPLPQLPDYYYARFLAGEAASSSSVAQEIESTKSASINRITLTTMGGR